MTLNEIFKEANKRNIGAISITDHDSIDSQEPAKTLADRYSIRYIYGLELGVSFSYPDNRNSKPVSLDFLAYQYDIHYLPLVAKLRELREYRRRRAGQILEKINQELAIEGLEPFNHQDIRAIEETVNGAFGRPHIANYLIKKGMVSDKQEAFDKYLAKCNVPKMPLSLSEASSLIKSAGGKLILAHPSDPNGTSLVALKPSLKGQQKIIEDTMLPHIDGIECWHPRHDRNTSESYRAFAREKGLMVTGGSDCHQEPVRMGEVDVPEYVVEPFGL